MQEERVGWEEGAVVVILVVVGHLGVGVGVGVGALAVALGFVSGVAESGRTVR